MHEIVISRLPGLKQSLNKVSGNDLDMDTQDLTCACKWKMSNNHTIKENRKLDMTEQGL